MPVFIFVQNVYLLIFYIFLFFGKKVVVLNPFILVYEYEMDDILDTLIHVLR